MPEESSVPDRTTFTPTRPALVRPVTGPLDLAVALAAAAADGTVVGDGGAGASGRLDAATATVDADVANVAP